MPREMPVLNHTGTKLEAGKSFWSLPQDIISYAFKILTYGEAQVLIYLIGNKPGWQISNIEEALGITEGTIRKNRRVLESLGFIHQKKGPVQDTYCEIIVDFDWIRECMNHNWDKNNIIKNKK